MNADKLGEQGGYQGAVSLSGDGSSVAVGSYLNDGGANNGAA